MGGNDHMAEPGGPKASGKSGFARFLPLILIIGALAAFFLLGFDKYLSFDSLKEHRATLSAFVNENTVLAGLGFVALYAVVTAVSLPGGAVLTLTAGFLFGTVTGSIYVVIGATIGATGLFLAARTAIGNSLRARAGPAVRRMEQGFHENAMSYLLFLRLIPLFPFWLVNLVPACLGVPLRTYVIGTFFGIMPGSIVFASVGNGLGAVFDAGKAPDLGIIFKPEILFPILGLAVLSLVPIIYKRIKGKSAAGADSTAS
jgi:uncharacterized membrane protein YdjX (TVP38/TMEM64 family)